MSTEEKTQLFLGLLMVAMALLLIAVRSRAFKSAEKSGSKLFRAENRPILEVTIWQGIIVFLGYGAWLIFELLTK